MGSNLIGATVVSTSSDSVGKIANLVLNENGAIDAAVIKVGGFFGFGGRHVAVTYDSLSIVRSPNGDGIDHVTISATKKDLIQAVPFKTLRQQQHAQR
jgi:sporulation protein YlmC with PRC-barrel domain